MAQTVPESVPDTVTAGDTISWKISLSDYSAADGWVLKYRLINNSAKIDITSAASGADHLVSVAAAASAAYAAGQYSYQGYVEKGSERYTVGNGSITIKPNLAAVTTTYDNRTPARKCLDELNTAFAAYGNKAWMQEYQINNRRMKFNSPGDFLAFRSKVQAEVNAEEAAERIARGESAGNKLYVRF